MANSTGQYATNMQILLQRNTTNTTYMETWTILLKCFQLFPALLGLIANIITLITLNNGKILSAAILTLLKHQSFVDAMVCGLAIPIFIQPPMWTTGVQAVDVVICYVWHNQLFFWYFVGISAWNLVYLAMERFVAVNKPLRHAQLTKKKLHWLFGFAYVFHFFLNTMFTIWVFLDKGRCVHGFISDPKIETIVSLSIMSLWAVSMYFLPVGLLVSLYSLILHKLRKRQKESLFQNTPTVSNASKKLLQTAFIVSICFIILMFFDILYMFLDIFGVTETYTLNTPLQSIGVFLTTLNSSINPYMYAYSLPVFRRNVHITMRCKTTNSDHG